jgi:uncharacterized protein (TIGR03437 family)
MSPDTTSLDVPTVGAAPKNPGASPLVRIDASGASQNLFAPLLAGAQSIAIDPENSQTIYAATPAAILRSTDGGNTFAALPNCPTVSQVWSVTVDPTNSNNLYAGTSPLGAFKSTDAGAAVMPSGAPASGTRQISVVSGGSTSNLVLMPSAAATPAIYSVDGSGFGQGYILNADGTLNSPSNPATAGAAITIFVTGVGQTSTVNGYAVTPLPVAVFVDGFYASGIAATAQQVPGDPGPVYEIGVYVPNPASLAAQNPNLNNFTFPPLVPVTIFVGAASSQNGIALSVH